jgi:alkanesulfonate monooxygenase SsuD/methylene tetrahydromethanopterin reductase-like flavin-dependent oxidoreductase (luciferase family)
VLRQLWSEPVVDYRGRWHRIDRAGIKPLPGRRIPIWFGGFTDVAYRRAAEIGDGFIFGSSQTDALAGLAALRRHLAAVGRQADDFGIEAMVNYQAGPDQWRRDVEAWREAGARYVSMRAMALRGMGEGLGSPEAHIDALRRYWEVVGELSQG